MAELVATAAFDAMRDRAGRLAPDPSGVLRDSTAFFQRGRSGAGRELLTDYQFGQYCARTAELAPPDLLAWLHREHRGPS